MTSADRTAPGHIDAEDAPAWSITSFMLFVVWLGLMASIALSVGFFVAAGDVPVELVVTNVVLAGVLVVGTLRRSEVDEPLRRCDVCQHAQEPTRDASRSRLWTCFACGWETSRRRTRQELHAVS